MLSRVSDSLRPHGLYSPWNSPGQKTGVGSLSCLLGIFPTQGSNPGLPHCRRILYHLSHKGSPCAVSIKSFLFRIYVHAHSVAQSCLTVCDPMDYSPPGYSIHGILQAGILEWVAISFSRGCKYSSGCHQQMECC